MLWLLWPWVPTLAIGFLGVVAAIMAIRADSLTAPEKIVWIVIAFALFGIETRSVLKDRDDFVARQAELRIKEDQARADEERARTEEHRSFQSLVDDSRRLYEHETQLSQETISEVTGGEAYAVIHPVPPSKREPNSLALAAFIGKNCKRYGIRDAHIYVKKKPLDLQLELDKALSATADGPIFIGNIGPDQGVEIGGYQITPNPSPGIETEFVIMIYALNKPTKEVLRLRNTRIGWEYSYVVSRKIRPAMRNKKTGRFEGETWQTLEFTKPEWYAFASGTNDILTNPPRQP